MSPNPRKMVLFSARYRYEVIESPLRRDKVLIAASIALARFFTMDEWTEIVDSGAFTNDVICLHNNPTAPPIPLDTTRPPTEKKPRLSPPSLSAGPRAMDHLVNDPIYNPNAPTMDHSKPDVRPPQVEAVFPDQPESSMPRAFDSTERPPESWLPTPDTSIPAHRCLGPSSADSQDPQRVPDSTCLPQDHKFASAARPPSSLQSPGTGPAFSTAAHALAHPSELTSGDRMRLGRVLQSRRHDSYEAILDRLEMLRNLYSMSQVEAATVLQQMSHATRQTSP